MSYEIIETHCVYENGKLKEVVVLWADNKRVRATCSTNKPCSGYHFLMPDDVISPDLIQRVAATGSYIDEDMKKKYFPGKRNWSR